MIGTLHIIGVGLIGSSLARAVREHGLAERITATARSQETIDKALELGVVDAGSTDVTEHVDAADVVVLCTPLSTYGGIVEAIADKLKPGAILTDVGSVKEAAINTILPLLSEEQTGYFVPAHPIAGRAVTGVEAGDATLFKDKKVILTAAGNVNSGAIEKVTQLWQACGAEVENMPAIQHDVVYAYVSHAVQFLASTFVLAFADGIEINDDMRRFLRVAGSDPMMWSDIFATNKEALTEALGEFETAFKSEVEGAGEGDKLATLVGRALFNAAEHNAEHAGTGFKDFTSIMLAETPTGPEVEKAERFILTLHDLKLALDAGTLMPKLTESQGKFLGLVD